MPQNFSISPRDQFLMSAGSGMLNQPYSVAPQGMAGIGDAVNKGLNVFQTALLAEEEKEERARKQKQISSFVSGLDPSLPPETRKLAGLLAQSPQGQQQLPALLNPEPETFGTQEYENYVTMGSANLDLPREHPDVQDWASRMYMMEQQKPKGSLVSMHPGDTEAQKRAAIRRDESFGKVLDMGKTSLSKLNDLSTLNMLLKGYEGGPMSKNFLVPLQGFMTELGLDPGAFGMETDTGRLQAARALEQRMVLGFRSTAEGEGMPGHLSDRDVRFLEQMPPGFSMTEQGRNLLYKLYSKRYQSSMNLEKEWVRLVEENDGTVPTDIYSKMQSWKKDHQEYLVDEDNKLTAFGREIAEEFNIPFEGQGEVGGAGSGNWKAITNPTTGEKMWWDKDTGATKPR